MTIIKRQVFEDGSEIIVTSKRYITIHSDGDVTVFKIKIDSKGNITLDEDIKFRIEVETMVETEMNRLVK